MNIATLEAELDERGWVVIDLPNPRPAYDVRDRLLEHLREQGLTGLHALEDYHDHVTDDDEHIETWHALAEWFWDQDLSRHIVAANFELFRALLGPDLHIQRYPYLRAVRPAHNNDAAPLHRDTYYGSSAYELVVLVPFGDVPADGAMRVISGSHVAPDRDYPYTQTEDPDVPIRSKKHRLGYSYAPRLLAPDLVAKAEPVPLKMGQALLFVLSLVHGAGTNESAATRFSVDIRLVNSLAPVTHSRGVHDDYYAPLSRSVLARTVERYRTANDE